MENPMTFRQHYADHQRASAWINANGWQFEKAEQRPSIRATCARWLIGLAKIVAPPASVRPPARPASMP
jgi:hypothetical protein